MGSTFSSSLPASILLQIQDVVDEPDQPIRVDARDLDDVERVLREPAQHPSFEEPERAADGGQRRAQLVRDGGDELVLELLDLAALRQIEEERRAQILGLAGHLPLLGERAGELPHLHDVERLLEEQQPVRGAEPLLQLVPRVVRIGGTEHDLDGAVDLPDLLDGLHAVPARRHPHVDEGHGVGRALLRGSSDHLRALRPLVGRVDEVVVGHGLGLGAEELRLQLAEPGGDLGPGEDLAEVLVDSTVVVDDEDSTVLVSSHA
jgi:hypothetical protein